MQLQFRQFRPHIGDVLGPHLAGDEAGPAFEKTEASKIMVQEPEPVFSRNAAGDLFQEPSPFLNISEQPRAN